MTSVDAIVIGAGVIGSSVALELARGGRSVVCVDKGPAAGAGSTSASSAIIRYSYSTRDAVLTAWESAASWRDWAGHLGVEEPDGMARFIPAGYLNLCTTGYDGTVVMALWDELGIPYEWYDATQLGERFPGLDIGRFYPPKRIDDPAFGDDPDGDLTGFYNGDSGYIDDPMLAAHNVAHAARHHGAEFRFRQTVVEIGRRAGHVTGVRLASGEELEAPVVVNVGGPHSAIINRMAGVAGEMRIGHRALRQEVYAVPAPTGFALDDGGPIVADLDLGQYFRPQAGGTLLVGGTELVKTYAELVDRGEKIVTAIRKDGVKAVSTVRKAPNKSSLVRREKAKVAADKPKNSSRPVKKSATKQPVAKKTPAKTTADKATATKNTAAKGAQSTAKSAQTTAKKAADTASNTAAAATS